MQRKLIPLLLFVIVPVLLIGLGAYSDEGLQRLLGFAPATEPVAETAGEETPTEDAAGKPTADDESETPQPGQAKVITPGGNLAAGVVAYLIILFGFAWLTQRNYLRKALLCLIPLTIASWLVFNAAWQSFHRGPNGFTLGIDLAGGTILVYEIDRDRSQPDAPGATSDQAGSADAEATDTAALAEALKRRLDPNDTKNITIRPLGQGRVEIILPTGGLDRDLTEEEVNEVKALISQVGLLEFRIVANENDDEDAFEAAEQYFTEAATDPDKQSALNQLAQDGLPPPPPVGDFVVDVSPGEATYAWVELGKEERNRYGLNNAAATQEDNSKWKLVEQGRRDNEPVRLGDRNSPTPPILIYSRETEAVRLDPEERANKKYDYFVLTRSSDSVKVGGNITINAYPDTDPKTFNPAIGFAFNSVGGNQFYDLTDRNKQNPTEASPIVRQLAIILDGYLIQAPTIPDTPIGDRGIITGESFTRDKVNEMVRILKSGALPATLKPLPVSENQIAPTLGRDTIRAGAISIAIAFTAILGFMLIYYRFAGLVATIALLSNLLLTVAFMVLIDAAFTLPGLAGLALTMGMAVDSNILIYERIREERDRGMNLTVAIRNGYDRAFSTIIDTHLSSIFTAVVLYIVGNAQLKGFGVSLTAGLSISLFTTLFLTRLIFDYAVSRKWLERLRMLRFFSRPNINFMGIRYYFFAATAVVTLIGLSIFLFRGKDGFNVDFVGGTVYGGKLTEADPQNITGLRQLIDQDHQNDRLKDPEVKPILQGQLAVDADDQALFGATQRYQLIYRDNDKITTDVTITLANPPEGESRKEQIEDLTLRASRLPDASVEQVFLTSESGVLGASLGGKSRYFTVRTTEPEPQLVKVLIDRLFEKDGKSLLAKNNLEQIQHDGNHWLLKFTDFTSPSYVRTLLDQEFTAALAGVEGAELNREKFRLVGEGTASEGRFKELQLEPLYAPYEVERLAENLRQAFAVPVNGVAVLSAASLVASNTNPASADSPALGMVEATEVRSILERVQETFNAQPQPERLETFDGQLASETQSRALYAILASWVAILVYLWFRFGNWTFGAAAVICLIHDLAFTLGAIACCHFVYDTAFGQVLGLQDFKIDLPAVAALLTLVGYSVNDTIVVFDRIREVRGKNPDLTPKMINDSVNQTLSRTLLASVTTFLVVVVLYFFGGEGVHLFSFVMVIGVIVGTYSSIYIASPLLLIFGEGKELRPSQLEQRRRAEESTTAR